MATAEPIDQPLFAQRRSFGREVLGPVLARFSRDVIMWSRAAPAPQDTAVLFASRGGWRLELLADLFGQRTGYGFGPVLTGRLMISRLLAMRGFLLNSDAAVEELARYTDGKTLKFVAGLLLPPGSAVDPSPLLDAPATAATIKDLLHSDGEIAAALRAELSTQHALLSSHIDLIRAGRRHVVFVDTGLFGSMFRVVDEGRPDLKTALVMLGRCFYRTPLPYQQCSTSGLAFQCEAFRHQAPESAVIRHWYLFETMFEPPMPSITRLTPQSGGGGPDTSPMASPAIAGRENPFFCGILDYIENLGPADLLTIDAKASRAGTRLAGAILVPSSTEVSLLGIGPSEPSPGDQAGMDSLIPVDGAPFSRRLASIRAAHWQEGQMKRAFPVTASLLLPAIAAARIAAGCR